MENLWLPKNEVNHGETETTVQKKILYVCKFISEFTYKMEHKDAIRVATNALEIGYFNNTFFFAEVYNKHFSRTINELSFSLNA